VTSILRLERWFARARKVVSDRFNVAGQTYVQHRVAEYRAMWQAVAEEIGASFVELADDLWELQAGGRRMRVLNDILEFDNPVTLVIAGRKPLVYRLLAEHGFRVPPYLTFALHELHQAYAFLEKYPYGCVVKPANGTSSGQGVTTHVETRREVRRAAILASLYSADLLIEPMVAGESYRLLVLRGRVIHAVRRRGLRVEGDGRSSIGGLLDEVNAERRERNQHAVDVDRNVRLTLAAQGLTLGTVLEPRRSVLVRGAGDSASHVELRTVYSEAVTDCIGAQLRADAERVARVTGAELLGVDFITLDASVGLEQSGGIINEINTTPGLHHHYQASTERFPKPAIPIAQALLDPELDLSRHGVPADVEA
jgi:cyanophycin synthetase